MDISTKLKATNSRLKVGNIGVQIECRSDRLNLRATLPPKPGSLKNEWYQQRLSLGIHANPQGLALAEAEARKVGFLLDSKSFDWKLYLGGTTSPQTIADWITGFEKHYFECRAKTPKSLHTWSSNYFEYLRRLPQTEELTTEVLVTTLLTTKPDSRTRQLCTIAYTKLAEFAELSCDLSKYRGKYNSQSLNPRDIPDDKTITQHYHRISSPAWQWVYGTIATFGLRPHEVFQLDITEIADGVIEVLDGKTGRRKVWAFYPDWVELFNLSDRILPPVTGRNNRDLGQRVAQMFRRHQIPFTPYDLRHAWAIRTMRLGLNDTLAAQQMGHSVRVHSDIYHHWIGDRQHKEAYANISSMLGKPL